MYYIFHLKYRSQVIIYILQFFSIQLLTMPEVKSKEKIIVIGAGPVGALAAVYAARRGNDVDVYELRSGQFSPP